MMGEEEWENGDRGFRFTRRITCGCRQIGNDGQGGIPVVIPNTGQALTRLVGGSMGREGAVVSPILTGSFWRLGCLNTT